MNRIPCIRRVAGMVAGVAAALLAFAATAPAAFATLPPPSGGSAGAPPAPAGAPVLIEGGMPGWQIVLIAAGAALLAAVVAVFLDRARLARRKAATA